jgi:phosphatidylglycerophosphatase A
MKFFNKIFLTFFGCGNSPKAQGTVGSFAAVLFWFCLSYFFFKKEISIFSQTIFWTVFLSTILTYATFSIKHYTSQFKEIDHKSIVLDEVLGQIFALQSTFIFIANDYFFNKEKIILHLLFCFILFRILDIKKPFFIGTIDRKMKNGFGVMFDDLICGILVFIFFIALYQINEIFCR